MGKFLALLIVALAVVFATIHYATTNGTKSEAVEAPSQQLERVRESAKTIEDDWQKRADDTAARFGKTE